MNYYTETNRLRNRDCDINGVWRFSAILEAMQETAGVHSTNMGWGRERLLDSGVAWVLVRTEVRGKEIGTASTLWMLMNLETREAVSAEKVGIVLPDNRDMSPPMPFPSPVSLVSAAPRICFWQAMYSDLDVNRHVNNTKYADWFCNQLGWEMLIKKEIHRMVLDYNAEVLPEQEIIFHMKQKENCCQMIGHSQMGVRLHQDIPVGIATHTPWSNGRKWSRLVPCFSRQQG